MTRIPLLAPALLLAATMAAGAISSAKTSGPANFLDFPDSLDSLDFPDSPDFTDFTDSLDKNDKNDKIGKIDKIGEIGEIDPTDSIDSLELNDSIPLDSVSRLRARLRLLAAKADAAPFFTSFTVYDLTADSALFSYNARKVMRPASCQKILTAVTALRRLGPRHEVVTRAYRTGQLRADTLFAPAATPAASADSLPAAASDSLPPVEKGGSIGKIRTILQGDIVVRGAFDPAFTYADLKDMARAIRQTGIDSIAGRLVADVSAYSGERLGKGWCWDDVPSDEVPYLTPLLFNHELPIHGGRHFVEQPERYFLETLGTELRRLGVGIAGSPAIGASHAAGATRTEVYRQSRTVEQLLVRMMKQSDNLYAEALFAVTGGRQAVLGQARQLGLTDAALNVADGSGLSLYNYVTADALVAFLRQAAREPRLFDALYHAMPSAGVDGTLSHRMKGTRAYANVHAKTGTVKGVSSLAGYVMTGNHHLCAFAIISNGTLRPAQARQLQDRLCLLLAE